MLKSAGIIIVLIASYIYGKRLSARADESVHIVESLIKLVKYISTSIKTERQPLGIIYGSFTDVKLEEIQFLEYLRIFDFQKAIESLNGRTTDETVNITKHMVEHLGGSDSNSQIDICDFVESQLINEADKLRNNLTERKRMYRLLPVLTGLSAIIVFL